MAVRAMMERVVSVNNVPNSDQAEVTFVSFYKDTVSGDAASGVQLNAVIDFGQTQNQRKLALEQVVIDWGTANGFPGLTGSSVFIFDWV